MSAKETSKEHNFFDPPKLSSEQIAFMYWLREHPWNSGLRLFNRKKMAVPGHPDWIHFVKDRTIVYSRILRIRWNSNGRHWQSFFNFRLFIGRLEIVFDPIKKKDWIRKTQRRAK